jgi:hypothetical protein
MYKMNRSSQCVQSERHFGSTGKGGNTTEGFAQLTAVKVYRETLPSYAKANPVHRSTKDSSA